VARTAGAVPPLSIQDHFYQFSHMAAMPRSSRSFFTVIWLACVWVIWKERNSRVFNNKAADTLIIIDRIKLTSFFMVKSTFIHFQFWLSWLMAKSPVMHECLYVITSLLFLAYREVHPWFCIRDFVTFWRVSYLVRGVSLPFNFIFYFGLFKKKIEWYFIEVRRI